MDSNNSSTVSVVIPIYNEEKYIESCLDSCLAQDYPLESTEFLLINGMSTDATLERIVPYAEKYPNNIRVIPNPKRIIPCAVNIGIRNSIGKYIIRLDAHSEYPTDYISQCVSCLESTDAVNVGGIAITKSKTACGKTISKLLSSKFGVGNSQFRTNSESGYVDTVPFGAFRREFFEKYGGFDERLERNEDNEINYRIRKNGGKVFLSNKIHFTYYCRDSVSGLTKMARQNGKWNAVSMKLCPESMGLRHLIPFLFVLSLIALPILGLIYAPFFALLGLELVLYTALDCFFSARSAESIKEFFFLLLLFPLFHINYGVGTLLGISFSLNIKNDSSYTPPKF